MTKTVSDSNTRDVKWNEINWKHVAYRVGKLQKRIAEAALIHDEKRVKKLQELVFCSHHCRLAAVHRVTSKQNRRTPGIDGVFWYTDEERFEAVERLNPETHRFSPFKRIYITKDHDKTKLRPLSIPTIEDRAVQALILIALDPVIETRADVHAYGYRRCRGADTAIRDIINTCRLTRENRYILKADIKECFESASHTWLLQHPPIAREILKNMLQPGFIHQNRLNASHVGLSRGSIASPTLLTHMLTGWEQTLKIACPKARTVRYVDDFLISAPTPEDLKLCRTTLESFLSPRGFSLSPEKTLFTTIEDGVDFIGWHLQMSQNTLEFSPSAIYQNELIERLRTIIIQGTNWGRDRLITKLNGTICGWGLYHAYGVRTDIYNDLDDKLNGLLWSWAVKRHPAHTRKWIYFHYWNYDEQTKRRIFSSETLKLKRFGDISIRIPESHEPARNPYIDKEYFRCRKKSSQMLPPAPVQ